jgi:hypothetical protein
MHRTMYQNRGGAKTLRYWSLVVTLVCAGSAPALADIINVGVNASVSGSGTMTVECGVALVNPPAGCINVFMNLYQAFVPLSFTSTTATTLGTVSGGTTATFTFGIGGPVLGSTATEGDLTTASNLLGVPNILTARLIDQAVIETQGTILNIVASVSGTADFTFDLTAESLMQVGASVDAGLPGGAPGSSSGTLLGPMGLNLAIPSGGASVVLGPGSYELDETLTNSFTAGSSGFLGNSDVGSVDFGATFQVIPEPRWTFFAPVLLVVLWRPVYYRLWAGHAVA